MGLSALALAGAGLALLSPDLPSAAWRWALAGLSLAGCLWLPRGGRWLAWTLFAAALAWLHAGAVLDRQWPADLATESCTLTGRVEGIPRHQGAASRFVLSLEAVEGHPGLAGRRVELHWRDRAGEPPDPLRPTVAAGERWRLQARLAPPRTLHNPGGHDAARQALANRLHAVGWVEAGSASRLAAGQGLDHWRSRMSGGIARAVPPAQAGFIRALAVGDTAGLAPGDWQVLRTTGLTHLVAISGFHVTLMGVVVAALAAALWRLFPGLGHRLPRPQAQAVAALLGAAAYAGAAGLGLPAVRTVLMVAVVCAVRLRRRTVTVWQCLAWALLLVLLVDPLALLAAGFWLSFAGVAWLAWSLGQTPLPQLPALAAAQGVATLGLLPLTVFLFGQASLAGPLVNLLAIPWWSLGVVPLCVLGLVLESVLDGGGQWAWRLAAVVFAPSWRLFSGWAGHPLAEHWLPESGLPATGLALLGAAVLLLPRGWPGRWLAPLLWLPLLWPPRGLPPPGGVDLHLLDVGQGQAVLVRTARHALLYDAGPATPGGFDAGGRVVVPALRALGTARLDALVISHGDRDHAGGAPAVLDGIPVGEVLGPPGMEVEAPVHGRCTRGLSWQWDGVRFGFLHPGPFMPYLGNASSCVLAVEAQGARLLLTGDIGQVVERELLRTVPGELRADVVQVAHHGSASSSLGAFIRATGARLALVSAGEGNRFGHPHPGVVERWEAAGAEVLQTPRSGAVRVWAGPGGLHVRERAIHHRRLWHRPR